MTYLNPTRRDTLDPVSILRTRLFKFMLGVLLVLIQAPPHSVAAANSRSASNTPDLHALQRDLDNARALQVQFPGKISELAVDQAMQSLNAASAPSGNSQALPNGTPITRNEVEPNDSTAVADVVNLSLRYAQVNAAISTGGDVDYFAFAAPAGARVWILTDTGGTQDPGATSRDTVIELLAADGVTTIEADDDDGTGNGGDATTESGAACAIAGRLLTLSGNYYVRVHGFTSSDVVSPYRLFIALTIDEQVSEVEPNNTLSFADRMQAPIGTRVGTISSGDVDTFSFSADFGEVAFVALDADPERDGTTFNAVLELRDGAGALIMTINSSGIGTTLNPTAEAFRFNITVGGNYFVAVKGFDGSDIGNYRLMVATSPTASVRSELEGNNVPATADYLEVAGNYAEAHGAITAGDVDYWRFDLTSASFVWIATDIDQIGMANSDTTIDLLASDGTTIIESDDDDGACNDRGGIVFSGFCSDITGTYLPTGTYYVRVKGFDGATIINRYRLYLLQTIVSGTLESESNNGIATANYLTDRIGLRIGDISPAGDVDYYRIDAKGGDIIYFAVDGSFGANIDLTLDLYDISGSLLLSVDSSAASTGTRVGEAAQFAIPLNEKVVYSDFVAVRAFSSSDTGSYKLMGYVLPGGDRIFGSGFE